MPEVPGLGLLSRAGVTPAKAGIQSPASETLPLRREDSLIAALPGRDGPDGGLNPLLKWRIFSRILLTGSDGLK